VHKERLPLLLAGVASLLAAAFGGLVRLGWLGTGPLDVRVASAHGPLMVVGFLGTVIGVERAVAAKRGWAFAAPALAAASALLAIVLPASALGPLAGAASALALCAIVGRALSRARALHLVLELAGAVSFLTAEVLLVAGSSVARAAPWWLGFLLLTIVAERVEASRVVAPSRFGRTLVTLAVAVFGVGLLASFADVALAARVRGAAMIAMGVWVARFDVPRRTIRTPGLPRFVAVSLLLAAVWLAAAGALGLVAGWADAGPLYDGNLHAAFLGVVMAMIFAHAPLVFPAVLGPRVPMRRRFYVHVGLLHASVAARVAGDLAGIAALRAWGGMLGVVAIVAFLVSTAVAVLEGRASIRARPVRSPKQVRGLVETFMTADHARLDALLARSDEGDGVDAGAFDLFRRGILRHIAMEEKVLLRFARDRTGEPLPIAARLRADHGQIARLLVPSPTREGCGRLRQVLASHNPLEEGEAGLYATCDALAGDESATLVERLRAVPEVPVAAYYDGPIGKRG
jgi:hypothetical protein